MCAIKGNILGFFFSTYGWIKGRAFVFHSLSRFHTIIQQSDHMAKATLSFLLFHSFLFPSSSFSFFSFHFLWILTHLSFPSLSLFLSLSFILLYICVSIGNVNHAVYLKVSWLNLFQFLDNKCEYRFIYVKKYGYVGCLFQFVFAHIG